MEQTLESIHFTDENSYKYDGSEYEIAREEDAEYFDDGIGYMHLRKLHITKSNSVMITFMEARRKPTSETSEEIIELDIWPCKDVNNRDDLFYISEENALYRSLNGLLEDDWAFFDDKYSNNKFYIKRVDYGLIFGIDIAEEIDLDQENGNLIYFRPVENNIVKPIFDSLLENKKIKGAKVLTND